MKLVKPGRLKERCKIWPLDGAEVGTIVIFISGTTNDSPAKASRQTQSRKRNSWGQKHLAVCLVTHERRLVRQEKRRSCWIFVVVYIFSLSHTQARSDKWTNWRHCGLQFGCHNPQRRWYECFRSLVKHLFVFWRFRGSLPTSFPP